MTRLPETAPTAYARSRLGPRVMRWMEQRGWLSGPRVLPREPVSPEIEAALRELRNGGVL
jgi:hypothetical protein